MLKTQIESIRTLYNVFLYSNNLGNNIILFISLNEQTIYLYSLTYFISALYCRLSQILHKQTECLSDGLETYMIQLL